MYIITVDISRQYILFLKLRSLDNKCFMFRLNKMNQNIIDCVVRPIHL